MNEYEALAVFFKEAQGDWWEQKENWLSDKRFGTWHGLRPDTAGHIEHLNLTDNRMQGKLHDSELLGKFVNLKSFNVSSNILRGPIPKNICLMQSLQELNLSWNGLVGPLPDSLWSLSELRILKLDNNDLHGFISSAISRLAKLKFLNLSCNKFEGEIPDMSYSCPDLQVIDFSKNKFVGELPATVAALREYCLQNSERNVGEIPPIDQQSEICNET